VALLCCGGGVVVVLLGVVIVWRWFRKYENPTLECRMFCSVVVV